MDIWKKGIALVKEVYKVTEKFPATEVYGLTSQMRRSSVSVPSNVAEGFRRKYPREFRQFLSVALGSLAELETQIIIAYELRYLDATSQDLLLEYADHISRMISNLLKKL